ncbi:hypothetical protein FY136_21795 [Agrobacterium tumefaciens]|uniref:hypothetical protein n=1 Tax=Agrobacterium tumefaciens TaxID=358 RepID=UPI0021D256F1|nr:hypothetical protein [Agrobacterium tumefaciens]UXT51856.1 hypothetical protein FY136_21795 [Agrobacterium tumefaciens]
MMKALFSASVLLIGACISSCAASEEKRESYIVFSQVAAGPFLFDDQVSAGLYRTFKAQGFSVGDIGLGDGGEGLNMVVTAQCSQLSDAIRNAEIQFKLKFESCMELRK